MKTKRAFTLVELMVVVGVIAVLVALLLPAVRRAREAAYTAACLGNLRQAALVVSTYAIDYHGVIPCGYSDGYKGKTGGLSSWYWSDTLYAASQSNEGKYDALFPDMNAKRYHLICPKNSYNPITLAQTPGYAMIYPYGGGNVPFFSIQPYGSASPLATYSWGFVRTAAVNHPSNYPVFFDSCMLNFTVQTIYDMAPPPAQVVTVNTKAGEGGQFRYIWMAHPLGANASFVDGHAETCSAARLFWLPYPNNAQTHTANNLHGVYAYFDYQGILHSSLPVNVPPPTY